MTIFRRLPIYFKIWKTLAITELQHVMMHRATSSLFFFGKLLRLAMNLVLLYIIKQRVPFFAGYTSDELVVFFLTYQLIDVVAQVFYRGVYIFSNKVRSGEFDFTLVKPLSSLFQSLTGKPDINDAIFLIPTFALSFYVFSTLQLDITLSSVLLYLALLVNSFLIVTALHILVLVVGVLTTEVDGVVWMYRDLSALGRFPISMYMEPLRSALFFLIPVGMMITIPAEVLVNVTPSYSISIATLVGVGFFFISLRLWNWSLKQYSSASS